MGSVDMLSGKTLELKVGCHWITVVTASSTMNAGKPQQPRQPVASFQNALEAPQILRGQNIQREITHLPMEPWYSRTARIAQVVAIPGTYISIIASLLRQTYNDEALIFYGVFIHDFGPHEHVFSAVSFVLRNTSIFPEMHCY